MEARPVRESQAALVRWMSIVDANSAGFVHGGIVMKLCDEAAGIAAVKHCRTRIVTAAIDRMTFLHPVHVGELLSCRASVNAVWHTSMEVGVRVEAENPRTGEVRHTSTAYLTMVAVDDEGRPTPVPPLVTESAGRGAPHARGRAAQEQPPRRAGPDPGGSRAADLGGQRSSVPKTWT